MQNQSQITQERQFLLCKNMVFKMNRTKSNGDHAVSYFIRLFALDIGCFIMSAFVFSRFSNVWLRAGIQLCDFVLLLSVTYSYFYGIGNADATLVNSGYSAKRPARGLIIGLLANIPFFITAIMLVLARCGVIFSNFYNYYKMLNSFFFPFLYTALPVDMMVSEVPATDIIFALSVQLIIPLLCMFSYLVGLSRFSFKEKLFYKPIEK